MGFFTLFSFLAKLSPIICCKQSTDQWSLVPSMGSVQWVVKAVSATLLFFTAEAAASVSCSPQHISPALPLSVLFPHPLSSRRSFSIYCPTLSSWHTWPRAPHLPHPASRAKHQDSGIDIFCTIPACGRGLGRAEPSPNSGHYWRLSEKERPSAAAGILAAIAALR